MYINENQVSYTAQGLKSQFQFCCTNEEAAMGIIVVNMILSLILFNKKRINDLPCTEKHWGSLIVL
ncbi:MAG: hypothetical protein LH615_02620 [Ferruginibacter sp.]|nr:hypothetical protein [Ferruginibacter sp.]